MKLVCQFILIAWLFSSCIQAKKLNFCKVGKPHVIESLCSQISEKTQSELGCIVANDRLSCMRLVINGIADFYEAEPEDLVIIVENLEEHFMVTHELRIWSTEIAKKQMTVLMHSDLDDISKVKKSKLCYPGLEKGSLHERHFTSFFEKRLVPRECDSNKTPLENRIAALSHNFEAACIAGSWSLDATYDHYLKSKYTNLCALCQNPLSCYGDDKYYGEEGSLICLTENVGDIVWTKWSSAWSHFEKEFTEFKKFNFLCSDGSVRSMLSERCLWLSEPWPVIVARSEVAEQVSNLITGSLKEPGFSNLFGIAKTSVIKLQKMLNPDTYLQQFSAYTDAMSPTTCFPPREIRWCVTSNLEYRKCETMRSATYAYNIYPHIFCVQESSREMCMEAVQKNLADVFVTMPNEELDAIKYNLKAILHMLSNNREDLNSIGILVKNNSNFSSFDDLKGAKACFTEYKSIGWNAVVEKIINITKVESYCSDLKLVSQYFGQSCVFGMNASNTSVPDNLYSLCGEFKENRSFNKYSDDPDVMALKCLSNAGDVAFVNISRAKEVFLQHGKNFAQMYKVLCDDETNYNGNCALTWTTLGSVMVSENIKPVQEDEIREMVLLMDSYYGYSFYGSTPLFSMYSSYDNATNVIFPAKTRHMHREITHVRNGKNYSEILKVLLSKQSVPCSANSQNISAYLLQLCCIFYLVKYCLFY